MKENNEQIHKPVHNLPYIMHCVTMSRPGFHGYQPGYTRVTIVTIRLDCTLCNERNETEETCAHR